jgi:uncharacterized hydrophobic protein (TIGR00271 family)
LGTLLHGGPVDSGEVLRIRDVVMFEGPERSKRLVRFFCLLLMATGIATFGLLLDSAATVIGAMIVAPLMLPITGLAFGISMGDTRAVLSSALVSLTGMGVVVALGFLLTLPLTGLYEPLEIGQVMARTAPRLLDLVAAFVIGIAGAFAMARRDVSDTLPGVAIAVSLVPPLANVGILLAFGETRYALGSLLLFLANYFAILTSGILVFRIMGFGAMLGAQSTGQPHRRGVLVSALGILLVAFPLALASIDITRKAALKRSVITEVEGWLEETGYRLAGVETETADGGVRVLVKGAGVLPPVEDLQDRLSGPIAGRTVHVEAIELQSFRFGPEPWTMDEEMTDDAGILDRAYQTLQDDDWLELAYMRAEAEDYLAIMKSVEELAPGAEWLEQRLDYYRMVEEAVMELAPDGIYQPAAPKPPDSTGSVLDTVLGLAVAARIADPEAWKTRVAGRPKPARAEALAPLLRRIFAEEGAPPELIWVAEVESTFNPAARSPVGALGLFQLMPVTAKALGLRVSPTDERLDPEQNARAAARYLRQLHGRFGSWELALAAYNGGQGRVARLLRQHPGGGFAEISPYLPAETRMYVPKVMAIISLREGRLPG